MYRVDIELNGVYDTYDKLDNALKKEYSEDEGLEYQAGITTQEQFEYIAYHNLVFSLFIHSYISCTSLS